jgi:hypothetical protein
MNKFKSEFISEFENIIDLFESNQTFGVVKFERFMKIADKYSNEYKSMVEKLEWVMDDQWEEEFCPICLGWKKNGHNEDCELGKLLEQ